MRHGLSPVDPLLPAHKHGAGMRSAQDALAACERERLPARA
jgi:hypothetical protein